MIMTKDPHGNYVKIEDIKQQDSFKGISPIDFKSNGDNLKNYRIYGNTVNGNSVGDRTANLFYKKIENANIASNDGRIYSTESFDLWIGKVKAGETYTSYNINSIVGFFTDEPDYGVYTYDNSRITNATSVFTFTVPNGCSYVGARILKNDPTAMLNVGSTALPYEPYGYRVPVTINSNTTSIYLPYQIRKVGDDAEYIDYGEQKQHRVRKNLLQNTATRRTINQVTFTVNDDGGVTCNGTATSNTFFKIGTILTTDQYFILTGCPTNGGHDSYLLRYLNNNVVIAADYGSGTRINQIIDDGFVEIRIASGYNCDNLTFYPMIRKADIEDDTYEPYIEETDVDVTLPALPTLSGTNTLSVNTNIKPSKVWGGLNDPKDILYVKDKLGNILFSKYYEIEDEPPLTYKAKKAGTLKDYRIYGNTVSGESVGDLVESGEHTGEYRVPVTINSNTTSIYLPYQIRKVGDDAEYIDYGEQKQHRVRKNLCQINKTNNAVISHAIEGQIYTFSLTADFSVGFRILKRNADSGSTETVASVFNREGRVSATFTANENFDVYVNGFSAVDDKTFLNSVHDFMFEKGATASEYEPYIENTELDVTLPALPTFSGTNTLSFETEVQPSDIYLKGKIEKKPKIYYKIYYYSQDGQTLLYTESVLKGSNGIYSGTPTKMADPQYTYTFAGWSSSTGQTAATPEVRNNIQNDKNVYAAFSQTLNTYTVYFYNESDTPIETVQNVPYGGTATYTGAIPTSSQAGYIFSGWSPSNTNITADTSCYAQFVDEDMYESISDTWSEIIANVSNGTYSTKYHIGDTKKIDLGTEGEVIMTIVGIDTDGLADNSGKAPITWISKQLLKTSHRMNPSYQSGTEGTGTLGGWEKTKMRSYLKETVKPLIPETVRNAIKPVKKYSRIYNVSGSAVNNVLTTEDVWIPSYKELFGSGLETLGPTYSTTFPHDASRIKRKAGSSAAWWWLRSAYSIREFNGVYSSGFSTNYYAGSPGGVALGFCT